MQLPRSEGTLETPRATNPEAIQIKHHLESTYVERTSSEQLRREKTEFYYEISASAVKVVRGTQLVRTKMLQKRKSVDRDDGDNPDDVTSIFWKVFPPTSEEELFASYVDENTYTNWKFPLERSSIRKFLGGDPAKLPLLNRLGLAQAFAIDYNCRPMIHAVSDFALGLNSEGNCCDFRGTKLAFNRDVVRDAFLLPSGQCRVYKAGSERYLNREELTKMFVMDPMSKTGSKGSSYSVSRLTGDYKSWARPILTFQGLLLGMPSPVQLTSGRTWFFSAYLLDKVQPSDRPDWAELVHYHLKIEVAKLKKHLEKRPCDIGTGSRFRCSCGTAIIRILMHLGFTEEELSHGTKKQRIEGGVPKAGFADRVTPAKSTGMLDLRVSEKGQGTSTGGESPASAASTDRSTDTNTVSCEFSSEDSGSLNPMDAKALGIESSRQLVEFGIGQSRESEETSGGLVNVQEISSVIESRWTKANFNEKKKVLRAIVTSMDAKNQGYASELLELKQKADAQFLNLKAECDNKLETLLSEKDRIERERDTTLRELDALREDLHALGSAHWTLQRNLAGEKEKSLCRICLKSRKDTICLPCLHFHYCFSCFDFHSKRTRTCPTCNMPVHGEVRARIWT